MALKVTNVLCRLELAGLNPAWYAPFTHPSMGGGSCSINAITQLSTPAHCYIRMQVSEERRCRQGKQGDAPIFATYFYSGSKSEILRSILA